MRRPLYGWLAADGVSLVGTRVSMVALPFFVLTTTGSPEKTGLVAVAEMLPLVVLKVLGGPVIDRVGAAPGRRWSATAPRCWWSARSRCCTTPGCCPSRPSSAWSRVAGALRGPGDAAKHALTPTLAGDGAGADGAGHRAQLDASSGPRRCSAPRSRAAWSRWSGRPTRCSSTRRRSASPRCCWPGRCPADRARPQREEDDDAPYVEQLRAGWRFLRGDRVLVGITVMVALTNLLDLA